MAHDINNALVVILNAADELDEVGGLPEQGREAVLDLRHAADQAAATTRQLRAFGRQASQGPLPLPLAPVLRRLALMLGRVLPGTIRIDLEIATEATISAD